MKAVDNIFAINRSLLNVTQVYNRYRSTLSETFRISRHTKETLLRIAARLQEETGRRIDFDEAIDHLVMAEDKNPDSILKFIGSVKGVRANDLLKELRKERRLDEHS